MKPLYSRIIPLAVIVLFSLLSRNTYAQSFESVKADPSFLWGEGTGETQDQADRSAVQDLVSQIQMDVVIDTDIKIENIQQGEDAKSRTQTTNTINMGSNLKLENCMRLVQKSKNTYTVLRYINKREIDKMYDTRIAKINDLFAQADHAEQNMKIGDALRFNYWGLKLITTLPNERQSALRGKDRSLYSERTDHLTDILNGIQIEPVGKIVREGTMYVRLSFKYKDAPIVCGDYKYNDGTDWLSAKLKDGVGVAELPENQSRLNIRIEYEYRPLWKSDPMVYDLLQRSSQTLAFPAFSKRVFLTNAKPQQTEVSSIKEMTKNVRTDSLGVYVEQKDVKNQVKIVYPIVEAIESRNYDAVRPYFTDNGWKWYEKLVKFGSARIIEKPELQLTAFEKGFLVRGIKANFSFKKNNAQFVEDLVFYVKDGKVEAVNFGLEKSAMEDIARHDMWNDQSRLILINFLENYKSAYALERLDYLESVFSEDALIIVGNKLPQRRHAEVKTDNAEAYEHIRMTKSEYMKSLKSVFAKQEFVNIHFEDASIKKTNRNKERYQVLIKQIYSSATYADTGYLFLLADLTNPEQPVIHVRVWDEEKNNLMNYGEWNY